MKRTKHNKESLDGRRIQVLSELTNRALLAARMGIQYGGVRDIYKALGYIKDLKFADFYSRYKRQEIAKAIIDRPVKATWSGPFELIEAEKGDETSFERAWRVLDRKVGMKTMFSRVDRLTGIGRYGILLLGLDDVKNVEGLRMPVTENRKSYKLMYLKPFSEENVTIASFEENANNERYGKPLLYEVEIADLSKKANRTIKVHHSRVIHITDDNLGSEIYGTPRLEPVFNCLMNIEKIAGGDAEMFWRGARPGFHGKVDKEYTMTKDTEKDLLDQLDEYENDLRRFLINEGVDIEALEQQISDPLPHLDCQLKLISSQTGIPVRVLTGSERGELASSQDTTEWLTYVQSRREDHAEPRIVRPTVDRLIELGILPKPSTDDYTVLWHDLFSISEKARVEIGKQRASALREYSYNPIQQELIPPEAFYDLFLGLTTDQLSYIKKMRDNLISDEELERVIKERVLPKEKETNVPEGRPMRQPTGRNGNE